MPLPFLVIAAGAGLALGARKALDAFGLHDPDDPGGGRLPATWGPGQAPAAPWRADRDRDNARVCWPGENGNAHLARWMNHEKGISLPGDIQTWTHTKLTQWLAKLWTGQLPAGATGNANVIALAAEADAMMISCMGKMAWEQIKGAPGKVLDFVKKGAKKAGDAVSDAADDAGNTIEELGEDLENSDANPANWSW